MGRWVDVEGGGEKSGIVKRVRLEYFAVLREQAGVSSEFVETDTATPAELFHELRNRHGFTLTSEALRVAINGDFCGLDNELCEGDEVVFIPPVAGG